MRSLRRMRADGRSFLALSVAKVKNERMTICVGGGGGEGAGPGGRLHIVLRKGASAHIARWISHSLGNNKDSPLPLPLLSGNKRTRVRPGSRLSRKDFEEQPVDTDARKCRQFAITVSNFRPIVAIFGTLCALAAQTGGVMGTRL